MALFMYSYFGYNLPRYFTNYFKLNEMIHSQNTEQTQIYMLIIKGQIMGNFLQNLGGPKFGTNYLRT